MESYLLEFITIAGIHLLAVMSPGPDFAMIVRNSLVYSRKTGLYTSIGLGLGILVHVAYSLVGIGLVISQSIVLFNLIKVAGAIYLIYIGYKSIKAKPKLSEEAEEVEEELDLNKIQAIRVGFLTNVLNPKATLFFLSLFSLVINATTPLFIKLIYGIEMAFVTFLWFSGVAYILSQKTIKKRFTKIQHYFERTMGALLIALGIKILISGKD